MTFLKRGRFLYLVSLIFVSSVAISQDKIQPTGSVQLVKDGFAFTEGPAWDPKSSVMYWTDIPNATIHQQKADQISAFTKDSKHANGIMIAADGRMLVCQMDGQVVAYDSATKKSTVLAAEYKGKRFNAPNDLVIDKSGGIYFTDPLFRAHRLRCLKASRLSTTSVRIKKYRESQGTSPHRTGSVCRQTENDCTFAPVAKLKCWFMKSKDQGSYPRPRPFAKLLNRQANPTPGLTG